MEILLLAAHSKRKIILRVRVCVVVVVVVVVRAN